MGILIEGGAKMSTSGHPCDVTIFIDEINCRDLIKVKKHQSAIYSIAKKTFFVTTSYKEASYTRIVGDKIEKDL